MSRSQLADRYSKAIWKHEENRFEKLLDKAKIPNGKLSQVDSLSLNRIEDFDKIPTGGGCYWIWTTEPVLHKLHKHPLPQKINNGEIIYNGIAKDSVKGRIKHHLLGEVDASWSGISLDIFLGRSRSHRKKAMAHTGKVPFIDKPGTIDDNKSITSIGLLINLHLTRREKLYIRRANKRIYYFGNGVNIFTAKHRKYEFKVLLITGLNSLYLEHIEKKWRKEHGLPKLCSYSSGR